ncbi:MAG: hypothetical protein CMN60_20740 [Sphingobium sp.]|nr:hypothetical protein [Sphingobium sp.]MBS50075.1 hypothetical protein [Sphingobium sp.]|tara:strand:+ start:89229 stop:89606 length:378 start_codon:yes stop_codon:yes gene_type:complete
MRKGIFLDDERNVADVVWVSLWQDVEWTVVRTYDDFVDAVLDVVQSEEECVYSFDHDIQDFKEGRGRRVERTGHDCLKFMCEEYIAAELPLPPIMIHTRNPIGAENMQASYEHYRNYADQLTDSN